MEGMLKVAAAIPSVRVGDCEYNASRIVGLMERAAERGARIVLFPELSVTAYTCGDLMPMLLSAAEQALDEILKRTAERDIVGIVGMPVALGPALYNCAVIFAHGRIHGIVPKTFIPNYAEFYEARTFTSGEEIGLARVTLAGQEVDFGHDLLFTLDGATFGVEICEDMWVPATPSAGQAVDGAQVLFNLSASPEVVGKHALLLQLVQSQSARTQSAYVYCSAGFGESSTDSVFAGNALVAEMGTLLQRAERFCLDEQLVVADIDVERITASRRRTTTFAPHRPAERRITVPISLGAPKVSHLDRVVAPQPFVPSNMDEAAEELLSIQTTGLAQRLTHIGCQKVVLGVSGGLDSTLALLVACATFDRLGWDRAGILGVTMPGFGTSSRTLGNAGKLMSLLGVSTREIPIAEACSLHFADIGLEASDRGAAYENAQARERTQILMDLANLGGGIVLGTGDLSELALGWATYNGDQMSMYGLNASIPKTLVRAMVSHFATTAHVFSREGDALSACLRDILDTPVSPELLPGEQHTESIVGSYELHDFFLYHFLVTGAAPAKILFLAEKAFGSKYPRKEILARMRFFFSRFFSQQFKRSAAPDGPKAGIVSLSPRGDWRMPSDAQSTLWLKQIDALKS